jgi:hypothetical protein
VTQVAKTTLFATDNEAAVSKKARSDFFPMNKAPLM